MGTKTDKGEIKTLVGRKVGHVPFHSLTREDLKKGIHLAETTIQGEKYVGTGETARLAQLALNQQVENAAKAEKVRLR